MELKYENIPTGYPLCFIDRCPLKDRCMHHLCGQAIPPTLLTAVTVTPAALDDGRCALFRKIETIRSAVGFARIFKDVRQCDAPLMRRELTAYLGGNGTYYRYMHGRRGLTPEQQQWIQELFARYGYTHPVAFDGYEECYRFWE